MNMTSQQRKRTQSHHIYNPSDIEVIEIRAREQGNPLLARGAFGQISIALSVPTATGIDLAGSQSHPRRRRNDVKFVAIKSIRNAFTPVRNPSTNDEMMGGDSSLSYLSNSFGFASSAGYGLHQSKPQEASHEDCDYEFTPAVSAEVSSLQELPPHDNIISLLSSYAPLDDPYSLSLIFPFCPLGDLSHLILKRRFSRQSGVFSQSYIRSIMQHILQGIHHCHDNGIVHCDIKPANILLHPSGNFQLTDFGLAKKYTYTASASPPNKSPASGNSNTPSIPYHLQSRQPQQPHGLCTLHYRAPEHLFGSHDYTPACDQWSMGLILTELLTLRPTFPGRNVLDQLRLVVEGLGPPNSSVEEWPEVVTLPDYHKVSYTSNKNTPLSMTPNELLGRLVPRLGGSWNFETNEQEGDDGSATGTSSLRNIVMSLLNWNPKKRSSAKSCLEHVYFKNEFTLQPWQILKEFQSNKISELHVSESLGRKQSTNTEGNEGNVSSCGSWIEIIEQKKLEGAALVKDMRVQMAKEGDPLHNNPDLEKKLDGMISSNNNPDSNYIELAQALYQKVGAKGK
jgi:serine/threonine protein kinase